MATDERTEAEIWLETRTLHTTKTAALLLGISKSRLNQICASGSLKFTMHGRDRAITQEEVDRYRAERKGKSGRPRKEQVAAQPSEAELKRRYRRINAHFKELDAARKEQAKL